MSRNLTTNCAPADPSTAFDPIEAALRQMFSDVEREEVPDGFTDLVAQFAKQQRDAGAS